MLKKGVILLFVLLVGAGFVDAATINESVVNSTLRMINITDADDLYAYDVNFSIDSGSVSGVQQAEFLGDSGGSEATYGTDEKNDYYYVYGSRLDNTQTGIDGDGRLFNITYDGELTLKGHLLVDNSGTATYTTYNDDGSVTVTTVTTGTTPGSSGGGGGGPIIVNLLSSDIDLTVVPSELSISAVVGREETREITIKNNEDRELSLSVRPVGFDRIVTVENSQFTLGPGEEETIKFKVLAEGSGLTTGKLSIRTAVGSRTKDVPVVINVRSENFLFDAGIVISNANRIIQEGQILTAQINLLQVGRPERVDVVANYIIKDFEGNSYLEDSETFFVLDEKEYVKDFFTESLPPGKYVLGLEIVYPGAFATSSAQFEVEDSRAGSLQAILGTFDIALLIVIASLVVLAVLIIFWAVWRRKPVKIIKRKRRKK